MQANELLQKYLAGQCTPDEKALVEAWYQAYVPADVHPLTDEQAAEEVRQIVRLLDEQTIRRWAPRANPRRGVFRVVRPWVRWAATASILLVATVGTYRLLQSDSAQEPGHVTVLADATPGGNRATLTLADGSRLSLTNARNGQLTRQGNTVITKLNNGQLVYRASAGSPTVAYNTLTTPTGGQYRLTLADGSQVWLNAQSSVRFPAAFSTGERRVYLTGEAYFEVAKDAHKPFRVEAGGQTVEVLGTHFAINSYADEPGVVTTLLEGAVSVSTGRAENARRLQPGEQALFRAATNTLTIGQANVDEAVAWKNGLFTFQEATIQTVMTQLARWYDVDVRYQGHVPDRRFSGSIYRNLSASQALELLSYTRLNFRIEPASGNPNRQQITITP